MITLRTNPRYRPFFGFTPGKRRPLPIDSELERIGEMLHKHRVVIVVAPTGTGKTLRVPQALMMSFGKTPIVVTQTRRDAVRWNGKRMAEEWDCRPGQEIGWRLAGTKAVYSHKTVVELVVNQTLCNRIVRNGGDPPPGIVVVDEAHDQDEATSVLLGLLKEGLDRCNDTYVVILSATINAKCMSDFYGGAPIVEVSGRDFPVTQDPCELLVGESRISGSIRAGRERLERFLAGTLSIPTGDGGEVPVIDGTMLMLFPGKAQTRTACAQLKAWAQEQERGHRVEILEYNSEVDEHVRERVKAPTTSGHLRVVCATDVARNSLTLPDVRVVVDSMQVRRPTATALGVEQLKTFRVSQAELEQAMGRGGRTCASIYVPVIKPGELERLRPYPVPHIQRASMHRTVLELAAVDRKVSTFPFLDPPEPEKIMAAETRLKRLQLLDKTGQITDIGRALVGRGPQPESGLALLKAKELGVLIPAAISLMALEEDSIFYSSSRRQETFTVDQEILSVVLSYCELKEDKWQPRSEPRTLSPEDYAALPPWIRASTSEPGFYDVLLTAPEYPTRSGRRWIQAILRRYWGRGSRNDFIASVNAYQAFERENLVQLQKLVGVSLTANGDDESEDQDPVRSLQRQAARKKWRLTMRQWCERRCLDWRTLRAVRYRLRQLTNVWDDLFKGIDFLDESSYDEASLMKSLIYGKVHHIAQRKSFRTFTGEMGDVQLDSCSTCSPHSELVLVGNVRQPMADEDEVVTRQTAEIAASVDPRWVTEVHSRLCTYETRLIPGMGTWREVVISIFGMELSRTPIDAPLTLNQVGGPDV